MKEFLVTVKRNDGCVEEHYPIKAKNKKDALLKMQMKYGTWRNITVE